MHMCVAHFFEDETVICVGANGEPIPAGKCYVDYYAQQGIEGAFTILDNGAHEGPAVSLAKLLVKGPRIHASEIVIPDAPHDRENTLGLFRQTLQFFGDPEWQAMWRAAGKPRLMFVPQVSLDEDDA